MNSVQNRNNLSKNNKLKTAKKASMGMTLLPLAACGGDGGASAPPGSPPPVPLPVPQTSTFELISTNTYLATNNNNGTFNGSSSNANLIVSGRGGNDSITTGAGNDLIFGEAGNDTINGGDGDDRILGGSGADTMDGGAGFDWLYYENSTSAVTINLATSSASGGYAQGDTFQNFEHVFGSTYNDNITGDSNTNVIVGYKGADTIDGGGGFDFLNYFASTSAVNVNLDTGTGSGGDANGDTFINIEGVFGSEFGDTLTGDDDANELYGLSGNDTINGLGGNDYLSGDGGNDIIIGGDGNDFIIGGAGEDDIDGGDGDDFISYETALSSITVNLLTGLGSLGDANGDTFTNIEYVYGSSFNDTITGDANDNFIGGRDGADTMDGGDGVDFLTYYSSTSDVIVNLTTGVGTGGTAQGDVFSNFEGIHGSDFADTLTGDAGDNFFTGFQGIDTLSGGAGDDTFFAFQTNGSEQDSFDGGADYDIIRFTGNSTVTPYSLDLASITAVNIESIRMGHDFRESLTLTAADVINKTDGGNTIEVLGHDTDAVISVSAWVYVEDVMVEDEIYHQYTSGAATVNIYLEIGLQDGFAKPLDSFTETALDSNIFEAINDTNSSFSQTHDTDALTVTGKNGDDLIGTGLGNDTIDGGAGNDSLAGHSGDDQIDGGAGIDTIFGGFGDDSFIFDSLDIFDGGSGSDTLVVSGTGENIDLSTINAVDMEIIDLTGTGNNQITLVLQDVVDVTDDTNQIIIDGNAGDDVTSAGQTWVQGTDQTIGSETYNTYTVGLTTLLVDEDITQNIS